VETVLAPSHDGVRVPLSIVRPVNAARDGSLPVQLIGYGSYGETDAPGFIVERYAWYEAGGASAFCHVRGGGYYGDAWHQAGRQATKPNTWLDFIACAEFLIREGYTRPERIVAQGASAGGITVGRAITERPDLFAGAVIQNGVLDAVRAETSLVGALNTNEFGSVATEEGFRALYAMSALHHVRQGLYPAVLLSTGLNDTRVASWQSGKLAAALQAATAGGPVLLRVDEAAGHAGETTEQVRELLADFYAFIMSQTGMPAYRPPAR
jgi:prolyl oligopeptidase